jgi:hypothetical protein
MIFDWNHMAFQFLNTMANTVCGILSKFTILGVSFKVAGSKGISEINLKL